MGKFLFNILTTIILSGIFYPGQSNATFSGNSYEDVGKEIILSNLHDDILFSIMELHFVDADSLIELSLVVDPIHPGSLYLQNYLEFLDALISGERDAFDTYLENSGQRIKTIRSGEKQYSASLICLSSIHLQSTVLSVYHAENYKAARHFYHSFRYLRQSEQSDSVYERNFLNRGLITLSVGSVPDEYRWLFSLLGMKGGIDEGIGYLEEYRAFASGASRLEACLILNIVSNTVDPGDVKMNMPGDCDYDSLTLFSYAKALANLSSGNSQDVIDKLGDHKQPERERELPFTDLLLGEALLNKLDTSACLPLERFTQNNLGAHYRHYGWHKLSWCYALAGEWELYHSARQEVRGLEEPYLDADRQALREAVDSLPLNIVLLRARLLYDGGYYQEALEELEGGGVVELFNRRDTLEQIYRLARIHHKLEEMDAATEYYKKVLLEGSDDEWYFAPNAALNLGMISETEGDTEKALELYRACLKINKSAYKKSIDYKARQGIRRIEELQKLR